MARQDAEQRTVALTYDPAQRVQSLINENGERFEFIYDAADHVIEERRVGGTRVTIDYDANGWPTAVTHHPGLGDDVLLATEHGTSSTTGQTPEISGWGDGTAGAAQAGRAGSQALRTEFIRDVAGRLLQKRTANHHYHYRYDTVDQLLSATKLQVQPDGSLQPLHTTTFEYDLVGNLIAETATDAQTGQSHRLTHSHDPLGNRTQTVLPALAGPEGQAQMERALNYLHYGSGHLHQINLSQRDTHAPDAQAIHQLICDIERDNLHQEILRSQGKAQTRFAYDPVGRLTGAWSQSSSQVSQPFGPKDPGAPAWQQALEQLAAPATSARSGHTHGLLKAWRYDKVGELRASRHSLQGDKGHSYDATGRILQTQHGALGSIRSPLPQAANETFGYDPAGNIQDNATQQAVHSSTALSQRGYVRDNLVRVFEDKRYFYDGHGRLIRKLAGKHTDQSFNWDEENNLLEVRTTRRPGTEHQSTQTTRFDYDALGRRVAKHDHFGTTVFIWEGMRLIEERRGQSVISYVYEPGSYVPLARLDAQGQATEQGGLGTTQDAEPGNTPETIAASVHSTGAGGQKNYQSQQAAANDTNDAEAQYWEALDTQTGTAQKTGTEAKLCDVYYFHTDQAGLPQELTNAQGQLVWQANYKTWGSTVSEEWEVKSLAGQQVHSLDQGDIPTQEDGKQQNLRFQGQYLDRETGLHYNTFRYYDADIGRFICPDPIGLDGGINLNGYVPNPFGWIDPLGWDWNYNLTDAKGNVYYHGRASDNQSMSDVMRRHGNNVGTDGKPRMGAGDTINRTTPVGTPRDTVRGIENNGTRTNGTLGRGGTSVRGNIDQGISDSKLKTKAGQARVNAANDHLRANGAKTAGNLKPLESKKFTPKKGC